MGKAISASAHRSKLVDKLLKTEGGKGAIRSVALSKDQRGIETSARYFCSGVEGHFWTDDLKTAERILAQIEFGADFTITDLYRADAAIAAMRETP